MDAFPLSLKRETESLESVFTTFADRSQSGFRNARSGNRHFWRMRVITPKLAPEDYRPFMGFGIKQEGRFQVFTVDSSILGQPMGVATGTPLTNAAASKGASQVVTDGWTNNTAKILKRGDLIQFSGHRKVYMVTDDTDTNGSGQATVQFKPALVADVADNETVVVRNCQFYMAFTKDPFMLETDVNKYASFDLEMEEVWNE